MITGMKHLTQDSCPHCGAATRSISVNRSHTNGQQFEERSYACDYAIRWSPNFSREEGKTLCRKSDEWAETVALAVKDREVLREALTKLDISEKMRTDVKFYLRSIITD